MSCIKVRKHPALRQAQLNKSALAVLASTLSLPMAVYAQSAPAPQEGNALPTVRVEGQREVPYKAEASASPKQTQPLLETPQTITVIKKELLQDQGATTLSEALRNTPGITFTLGENGNTATGDSVFMRGFDTSNSIFLDGVRDVGTIVRDTFNVEQVEIIKGPAGADFGRGNPSGYINLISKVPLASDQSNGSLAVGTDSRVRATADLNRALNLGIPGSALRLNLMADRGDKAGRNVVKNESIGFAPSLAFGLGTSTRIFLNYVHVEQDNIPDGGIPAIGFPGYRHSQAAGTAPAPVLNATQIGLVNAAVNGASRVSTSNFYGANSDYDKVDADMITARIEHDLSPVTTFRNVSRYGRTRQEYVLTGVNALGNLFSTPGNAFGAVNNPALWTVARSRQGKDQVNEILTNQTSLNTSFLLGGLKHTLGTGLEFIYERQNALGFTAGTTGAANLYNPSTADVFGQVTPSGAVTTGRTTTGAVYVFDNIELSPQWELNAGLRWERYRTEYTSIAAPAIATGNTVATQVVTNVSARDSLVNGKVGLVFKPAANGSIYLAYASSAQPPGGANFTLSTAATNINNPNLDPQKSQTVELGTKWELLDKRVLVTAAAFQTTNKNDLATADPVTGEITQFGERKVRGLEFGASGAITAAWQVSAGLAFLNAEITEGASATTTGAAVQYTPKQSFTAWTTYKFPFGLTLGGGARYISTQATSASTAVVTNLPQIPSYWVFDALAGYEVNKNLKLQLNISNLTDKFYLNSVNSGRTRYTLGAPRTALLTANVEF
ncbi:MAG TPA: catecholate siderophore receptor Fiu [Burkholderiaceae bacterium]